MPLSHYQISQHVLSTSEGEIPFELRRSRRIRSLLTITVDQSCQVKVSAPFSLAFDKITDFILKKSNWVHRRISKHQEYQRKIVLKNYKQGAKFYYLGKEYLLHFKEEALPRIRIEILENVFSLQGEFSQYSEAELEIVIKDFLQRWYKKQAQEYLATRVFYWARIMGLEVTEVTVRSQRRIWGSCHPRFKKISLNWQIIMAPVEVIDYVIVHELCHLWVSNHSKWFWQKVEKFNPDYKLCNQWLKDHAVELLWR